MPALTLHLLSLTGTDPKTFVQQLRNSGVKVIVASRARHVVIHPTSLDTNPLASQPWDLMVLLQSGSSGESPDIPRHLRNAVRNEYKMIVGIPSKLVNSYPERDAKLKREAGGIPLTGSLENAQGKSSSQNLEVSPELLKFMDELTREHDKPVTMLNLLHFQHPGGKESYYNYGQAFIPVAGKRGGSAKLVGNVVKPANDNADSRGAASRAESDWWNEISIVHYPSIRHFCDMLAGEDYQAINEKHRLGALRDTFLLCTTEFDLEGESAKL